MKKEETSSVASSERSPRVANPTGSSRRDSSISLSGPSWTVNWKPSPGQESHKSSAVEGWNPRRSPLPLLDPHDLRVTDRSRDDSPEDGCPLVSSSGGSSLSSSTSPPPVRPLDSYLRDEEQQLQGDRQQILGILPSQKVAHYHATTPVDHNPHGSNKRKAASPLSSPSPLSLDQHQESESGEESPAVEDEDFSTGPGTLESPDKAAVPRVTDERAQSSSSSSAIQRVTEVSASTSGRSPPIEPNDNGRPGTADLSEDEGLGLEEPALELLRAHREYRSQANRGDRSRVQRGLARTRRHDAAKKRG
ncbi:hypothetical protein ACRE_077200 [Hapsidospora chrysogenum ATCC 11550]|uniref:Uncharacterized protein n=1 Tax=Hapsidospora chrysogenum (strain ATCC 11550 / CBS 779.69 / DSM 880 / IAM 14645 / JCM 23072 / IMI 49137) TaxID=857340 RepID=A0A086SWU1_HAPC1|nr:hypothetical protein ACRE_077200 [Hapsidospora chrysogenum ATCC 11550]